MSSKTFRKGNIEIMTTPSVGGGWFGFGKRGKISTFDVMQEPGSIYFDWADTEQAVIDKLVQEISDT